DRVQDLTTEIERSRQLERAVAHDDVFERLALHVLHHDEEDAILFFRGEHCDDVRMAHRSKEPRLLDHLVEIEVLLVWNFEGDFLVDPGVFSEVNRAEATTAQGRQNAVLTDDLTA